MNYRQPHILFTPAIDDASLKENVQREAELFDILEAGGIKFQEVLYMVEGIPQGGVMVQYSPDNESTIQSLAADFGVENYVTLTANGEACFHRADGSISDSYDHYNISKTAPVDNYIEINDECFLHFD